MIKNNVEEIKKFTAPTVELVRFSAQDVITDSRDDPPYGFEGDEPIDTPDFDYNL